MGTKLPKEIHDEANRLMKLGFQEDTHFFITRKIRYTLSFCADVIINGYENEDESQLQERVDPKHVDLELVGVTDQDTIGFEILDIDGNPFNEKEHYKEVLPKNCVICDMSMVVKEETDPRIEDDGLKCFEHRGISREGFQ